MGPDFDAGMINAFCFAKQPGKREKEFWGMKFEEMLCYSAFALYSLHSKFEMQSPNAL
jgi:hypothetical protein